MGQGLNIAVLGLALAWSGLAGAAETVIGQPTSQNGMDIKVIYIQAVEAKHAEHHHEGHQPTERGAADVHLEARIQAAAKNPNGFLAGSWIPYLNVQYALAKEGSNWTGKGVLLPMAASDGPHYGDNVKLDGPGKYTLTMTVSPPSIPYHADKETGVSGWWDTFNLNYDFAFLGTGKKGGY